MSVVSLACNFLCDDFVEAYLCKLEKEGAFLVISMILIVLIMMNTNDIYFNA